MPCCRRSTVSAGVSCSTMITYQTADRGYTSYTGFFGVRILAGAAVGERECSRVAGPTSESGDNSAKAASAPIRGVSSLSWTLGSPKFAQFRLQLIRSHSVGLRLGANGQSASDRLVGTGFPVSNYTPSKLRILTRIFTSSNVSSRFGDDRSIRRRSAKCKRLSGKSL